MWLSSILVLAVAASDKPKLAVLDVTANGVDPAQAQGLGAAISKELASRGFFEVISANDIRTLLGVERQKALLGCGDSSCTAELSGALGARFVLQSSLTKLGDSLQLSVQMLDTAKAVTVARSLRLSKDVLQLSQVLPWVLADATATPMPPAPSKVLPWLLIAGGATAFAAGGVVAIDGFSRERALRAELKPETGVFKSLSVYQEEIEVIQRNKAFGLTMLAGGAALVVVGRELRAALR
jgi:TolB-like protein